MRKKSWALMQSVTTLCSATTSPARQTCFGTRLLTGWWSGSGRRSLPGAGGRRWPTAARQRGARPSPSLPEGSRSTVRRSVRVFATVAHTM